MVDGSGSSVDGGGRARAVVGGRAQGRPRTIATRPERVAAGPFGTARRGLSLLGLLAALVVVLALAAPAITRAAVVIEPADDLVANWSMESSATGWGGWNATVTSEAQAGAPDGARVARVACGLAGGCPDGYTFDDDVAPVRSSQAGTTYTAALWLKGSGASIGKTVRLKVRQTHAGGDREAAQDLVLTGSFQRVTATLTARETGDPVDVYVAQQSATGAGEAFFADAVTLTSSVVPADSTTRNASFESGTSGWIGYNAAITSVSPDPTDAPHGRRAARVACSAGGAVCSGGYSIDDAPGTVGSSVAGATYRATAMVKASTDSLGKTVGIVVRETDPTTGTQVSAHEGTATLGATYARVSVAHTATASGNQIDVYVRRPSTTTTTDAFLVDAIGVTTGLVPQGSQVLNPSFERGVAGWLGYNSALTRDTTTPTVDGAAAVRVACDNGGAACTDGYTLDDDPATVESTMKGYAYTARASVRAVGTPGGRTVGVVLREWDPVTNTQVGATSEQQVTLTSTFQPVEVTRTATNTGNRLEVYVRRPSGTAGEAFLADAVSLRVTAFPAVATSCGNLLTAVPARGACARPYTAASPFNQPLSSAATVPSTSAATVSWLTAVAPRPSPLVVGDPLADYGVPLYRASASDPLYTLRCRTTAACYDQGHLDGRQIRIPAAAEPAGCFALQDGRDAHLTVVAPSPDTYGQRLVVDLWQVTQKSCSGSTCTLTFGGSGVTNADAHAATGGGPASEGRGGTATSAGVVQQVRLGANVGATTPETVDEFGAVAAGWGSTLGAVRAQELENGAVEHALALVVPCVTGTVAPAHHTDGDCASMGLPTAGAPKMGQRFRLNLTDAQILALDVPDWRKAILRALARYGAFVTDTGSGNGWGFEVESGIGYTTMGQPSPWLAFARRVGLPGGDGLPWDAPNGVWEYDLDLAEGLDFAGALQVVQDPATP